MLTDFSSDFKPPLATEGMGRKEQQRIIELEQTVATLQDTVKALLAKIQEPEERLNRNSSNRNAPRTLRQVY